MRLSAVTRPVILCTRARYLSSSRRIRVYTKTGDKGTSQLFTGERREKHEENLALRDFGNEVVVLLYKLQKKDILHCVRMSDVGWLCGHTGLKCA